MADLAVAATLSEWPGSILAPINLRNVANSRSKEIRTHKSKKRGQPPIKRKSFHILFSYIYTEDSFFLCVCVWGSNIYRERMLGPYKLPPRRPFTSSFRKFHVMVTPVSQENQRDETRESLVVVTQICFFL